MADTLASAVDPGMNELSIFDAVTGTVIKEIPTAAGLAGILFTPDGKPPLRRLRRGRKDVDDRHHHMSIVGEVATGTEPDGMAYALK